VKHLLRSFREIDAARRDYVMAFAGAAPQEGGR